VLPDRVEELKDLAARSLPSWIAPKLGGLAAVSLAPSAGDCSAFVEWVAANGLQFLLPLDQLVGVRQLDHRLKVPALGKSVESMASTIEHMLNTVILKNSGTLPRTLKPKVDWLWSNLPSVVADVKKYWRTLADTGPGFASQQTAIRGLVLGHSHETVVRLMLEVGLIRNQGAHLSYPAFDEDMLRDCMTVLVEGAVLIWMNARARGLI